MKGFLNTLRAVLYLLWNRFIIAWHESDLRMHERKIARQRQIIRECDRKIRRKELHRKVRAPTG
jgi:hypothetical protein